MTKPKGKIGLGSIWGRSRVHPGSKRGGSGDALGRSGACSGVDLGVTAGKNREKQKMADMAYDI